MSGGQGRRGPTGGVRWAAAQLGPKRGSAAVLDRRVDEPGRVPRPVIYYVTLSARSRVTRRRRVAGVAGSLRGRRG